MLLVRAVVGAKFTGLMGILGMNIGVYREAAEHCEFCVGRFRQVTAADPTVLAALSLHPSGGPNDPGSDSASLWFTLKRVLHDLVCPYPNWKPCRSLILQNLPDLADKAHPGQNLEVFKQAGFEF